MSEPTIICPNCKSDIKLTESLAAPLIAETRKKFELQIAQKELDITKRESAIEAEREVLAVAKQSIDEQVSEKLKGERAKIAVEEAKKARLVLETDLDQKSQEIADLKVVVEERNSKLVEARKAQAELVRKQRELDDARSEMEVTIETRVQESLASAREKAKKESEDAYKLKVLEKEEQIASMGRQIEELKRRAEQGSQQLQGEVQEMQLEALLRSKFPWDVVEPVPKGELGADMVHRIVGASGQPCGTILWEVKRTKNWSDGWLAKLRADQREAKAEIALLITHALPKGVQAFDLIDGVWVAEPKYALPLALALRESLIGLAAVRQASDGQNTKMELVYRYLTGPRFRHRVEAIVEHFSSMQDDLDRERKTLTRLWAKREEQIRGAVEATAGMYGDLQGIAGKTLQEIEGLEVTLLDVPTSDSVRVT